MRLPRVLPLVLLVLVFLLQDAAAQFPPRRNREPTVPPPTIVDCPSL